MKTAAEYREMAAAARKRSADSWERSDTDGFVSQWASDLTAREYDTKADIADNGGRSRFPALFDTDGNLVPAKLVHTRYGTAFGLLPSDDPRDDFTGWFNPSEARSKGTARKNDARKGYYVGYVLAPADAKIGGGGTGLAGAASCSIVVYRTDGGFSRDVEILDNGHGDTDLHDWYDVQES